MVGSWGSMEPPFWLVLVLIGIDFVLQWKPPPPHITWLYNHTKNLMFADRKVNSSSFAAVCGHGLEKRGWSYSHHSFICSPFGSAPDL